ncbi:MAG: hypothetical protein ACI9GW_003487 [Halieaceae bacterium]
MPEEFPGFVDVFNGRLDKDLVVTNKSVAVNMLMGFAKNA